MSINNTYTQVIQKIFYEKSILLTKMSSNLFHVEQFARSYTRCSTWNTHRNSIF